MESQPQNPEFRINPENFHPCSEMQGSGETVWSQRPIRSLPDC